jgi:hypothetical protein
MDVLLHMCVNYGIQMKFLLMATAYRVWQPTPSWTPVITRFTARTTFVLAAPY